MLKRAVAASEAACRCLVAAESTGDMYKGVRQQRHMFWGTHPGQTRLQPSCRCRLAPKASHCQRNNTHMTCRDSKRVKILREGGGSQERAESIRTAQDCSCKAERRK